MHTQTRFMIISRNIGRIVPILILSVPRFGKKTTIETSIDDKKLFFLHFYLSNCGHEKVTDFFARK